MDRKPLSKWELCFCKKFCIDGNNGYAVILGERFRANECIFLLNDLQNHRVDGTFFSPQVVCMISVPTG